MLLLALAAILDLIWHASFGLDETRWSTPHAMLAWGWATAALGCVSARLALREHRPLRWWTRALLGLILIGFTAAPVLGPLQNNQTLEKVEMVAAIPVLAEQPAYQHTARIYDVWGLTRSHVLFVVLGGVWTGTILSLLRIVDRRAAFVLLLLVIWMVLTMSRDRSAAVRLAIDPAHAASWLPIPLLPAALIYVLGRRGGLKAALPALLAGAVFGGVSQAIWPSVGVVAGAALGAPAALLGELIGSRLGTILEKPTPWGRLEFSATALLAPLVTGLGGSVPPPTHAVA